MLFGAFMLPRFRYLTQHGRDVGVVVVVVVVVVDDVFRGFLEPHGLLVSYNLCSPFSGGSQQSLPSVVTVIRLSLTGKI